MSNTKYLLGLIVFMIAIIVAYDNVLSHTPPVIEKKEKPDTEQLQQTTEQSAPAELEKVLNLGMTFEEFKSAFNKIAVERNVPQLVLTDIRFFDSEGKFVQQYPAGLYLFGIVDNKTGFLKEVIIGKDFILDESKRQSEVEVAGIVFLVAVTALNPASTPSERAEILNKLSTKAKNSSVVIGNAEYSSLLFDKGKSLSLSIKAKDSEE